MRRAYAALLRLYPAAHRAIFAPEMLQTFEQASLDRRSRGTTPFFRFACSELLSLVTGLVTEWIAKWTAGTVYLTSCCPSQQNCDFPSEVVEAQHRLQLLLRRMEFAIAHHDFPKARLYSDQERALREHVERLLSRPEGPPPLHPC